jgi:hypothetical protein
VWAKELFKLLFGDPKTSMMYEEKEDESVYMREVCVHACALLVAAVLSSCSTIACMLCAPDCATDGPLAGVCASVRPACV